MLVNGLLVVTLFLSSFLVWFFFVLGDINFFLFSFLLDLLSVLLLFYILMS